MVKNNLLATLQAMYKPLGFAIQNFIQEQESQEYDACRFEMNNKLIVFRTAKITPTKTGQFVTFWKRSHSGPIMPYDDSDSFDFFIVNAHDQDTRGQFIFPKKILLKKGILSKNNSGGKRGFRVYPPWNTTDNAQALKTQSWQAVYFVTMQPTDVQKITHIFSLY